MNKFLINGTGLGNKEIYGVDRFTLEILKELDNIVEKDTFFLAMEQNPFTTTRVQFKNIKVLFIAPNDKKTKLWNQFGFVKYAKRNDFITIDLSLKASILGTDVFCIHDCIRELFPQNAYSFKTKLSRLFYKYRIKKIVSKAKLLITVSEYSKNDILKIYPKSKNKNISVIYNAWQHYNEITPEYQIIDRFNLTNKKFCFSLGSYNYHKNIKWIFEAAKQNNDIIFVVSGTKKFYSYDNFEYDNVIFTGYLSDGEVKALMERCYVFIQPSLYEGFGIPPIEAMSVGARCIVSNASALPEIYGNSVWYIDPLKYDNISIDKIMSTSIEDNSKILEKYSWKQSAEKLLEVLKAL